MCVCVCLCVINYHYANFLPSKLKLCFLTFFLRQPEEMTTNTVAWQSAGILLDHSRNTDHPLLFNELLSALPSLIQIWPGKKKKKKAGRTEDQCRSLNPACSDYLSFSFYASYYIPHFDFLNTAVPRAVYSINLYLLLNLLWGAI